MESNVVIRPLFGRILAVLTTLLMVLGVVTLIVLGDVEALARYVWPLAFVAYLTWLAFWQPYVSIGPAGIRVRNVFRTFVLPWPSIVSLDTQWSLTLETRYGRVTAWAAPAPGRHGAMRAGTPRMADSGPGTRPSEVYGTDSGDAAAIIRRELARLAESGHPAAPRLDPEHRARRIHVVPACVLVLLAVATVLGVVL